jgi:integrase
MRKGEIFNIEWQNVTLTKPTPRIYLPDSKSGEPRTIPLSTRAVNALKSIQPKAKNDRSGKVFKSGPDALRYQWRLARKKIGSPDLRIHDLRHEGTSRLFERGLNVLEVASITGHKQIQMLKRYTHLQTINLVKKLG